MIFRTEEGKYIGKLDSGTFKKSVARSVHMLREPEAWAIDSEVVRTLGILNTCKKIVVYDYENGFLYEVDFELFIDKAINIDRGHGAQKALPLIYWKFKYATKGERYQKYSDIAYVRKYNQFHST
jgi:hypothetical protein